MLHGPVDTVRKYARFLGYLGLRVVALAKTRGSEDSSTEGSVSSFSSHLKLILLGANFIWRLNGA